MKVLHGTLVCPQCDAVYRLPALSPGDVAQCSVCDAIVWRSECFAVDRWLALTLASAIMFTLANAFPVISAGVQNFQNDVTLWSAMTSLAQGAWAPLAAPVAIVAIIAPFFQIVLLGWILAFAWCGRCAPAFRHLMKLLMILQPWSMAEVAFLGLIVACIKLSDMVNVSLGAGTWAMFGFLCLTALTARRDIRRLWNVGDTGWRNGAGHAA